MNDESKDVPVIDIAPLFEADAAARSAVVAQLREAAQGAGFFYLTGHRIPETVFERMLAASKGFFALPLDEKMQVYIGNSRNHRGYVPEGEEVFVVGVKDAKEAYDLSLDLPQNDPDYRAGNPLLGPNQWPDLPGFAADVKAYYDATFEVGRVLMRAFAMAMGEAPDRFDAVVQKPPSQLRLIHYPFTPDAIDRPGIGAHTDFECFTLLKSTAPGLEVVDRHGKWVDVPPLDNAYVVNIGDMLELWTNGEYKATTHRVRKVREERYSFPLFFAVDYHTRVAPLARFVTAERPARGGLVAGEHLFSETGKVFTYLKQRQQSGPH